MADLAEQATLKLPPVRRQQLVTTRHEPPGSDRPPVAVMVAESCALLCLGVVLLQSAADVLTDDPIVWVLTPLRLVLLIGLVAALVALQSPLRMRSPLDLALVVLLLAATVATFAADQDWSGWRGALTAVAVFYLAVGVRRRALGSAAAIGLLALLGVAITVAVALQQFSAGTPTGFCRGALNSLEDVCGPGALIRATGTFSNPNLLAAFLVLLLPLAAYGSTRLGDRASRLLGTAVVALGYAAVMLTASRAGALGAVVGAGAAVVLRRPTRRRLLASAVAIAATAALFVLAAGGSLGVREDVWAAATKLVAAHPLGVGPGEGGALIAAEVPGDEAIQHAHNMWLHYAVEYGLLGLAAVVAITALAAIGAVRLARRGSIAAVSIGAGLAGFAAVAMFDHPANALRLSVALWLVLGLLAAEFTAELGMINAPTKASPSAGPAGSPLAGRDGPAPSDPAHPLTRSVRPRPPAAATPVPAARYRERGRRARS